MFNWFFKKGKIKEATDENISISVVTGNSDNNPCVDDHCDTIKFIFDDNDLSVCCPKCDREFFISDMREKYSNGKCNHNMAIYRSKIASRFRLDLVCPICGCKFEKYFRISEVRVSEVVDICSDVTYRLLDDKIID